MKVLLASAPFRHPQKKFLRQESLGQLYLAAALGEKGFKTVVYNPTLGAPRRVADGYEFGPSPGELDTVLRRERPDVVGITCHNAYSVTGTELIARAAKSVISAQVLTVAGGIYPTVHKERILDECPSVDYAFQGESERTLADFLDKAGTRQDSLQEIDGLIFRADGRAAANSKTRFIEDLDGLPFPAWGLIDLKAALKRKTHLYGLGAKPVLPILTSRSCPNRCSFCNMKLIHGPSWRARSPRNVADELELLVRGYGARQVFVMDDNFTCDPERAKSICREIMRRGLKFEWNTPHGISVKDMDFELAVLMRRAGCRNVCIGIESGSEHVRNELMGKGISDAEVVHAVGCLKKAGIPVCGLMILGYPGETERHFRESLAFIKKLPLSLITAGFVCPFPGTRLHDRLREEGVIGPEFHPPLDDYLEPVFSPPGTTREELKKRRTRLLGTFFLSHAVQVAEELILGRARWFTGLGIRRLLDR